MSVPTHAGLDLDHLGPRLARALPELALPLEAELVTGGRSNLTYAVRDAAGRGLVLRRPPLGEVPESAHDVGREHRIVAALYGTAVPVPRALGLWPAAAPGDAPVFAMDLVEGVVVRTEADARASLDAAARARAGAALVDALCDLHAVDPDDVGLGDLGRRDAYVDRQLRRWHRQFHAVSSRRVPIVDEVHALLAARVPAQVRAALVHGDFRIDNAILAPGGEVAAVLDWELCTLGDPLADLGLLLVYWPAPGEDVRHQLSGTPTLAGGFLSREELVERYAARTGADVSGVAFFEALGLWKLACIAEGIHERERSGAMGTADEQEAARVAGKVELLALRARDLLLAG